MDEDKDLPIKERLKLRALKKEIDDAMRPMGIGAHTPRPFEEGDRVSVSELKIAGGTQEKFAGQKGIITQVEYMGAYDPAKYEPGTFLTQRWNPAQDNPHEKDFAIPVEEEKIRAREEMDRLHDWRIHVHLESGEDIQLWPHMLVPEVKIEQEKDYGIEW